MGKAVEHKIVLCPKLGKKIPAVECYALKNDTANNLAAAGYSNADIMSMMCRACDIERGREVIINGYLQ